MIGGKPGNTRRNRNGKEVDFCTAHGTQHMDTIIGTHKSWAREGRRTVYNNMAGAASQTGEL